jgi:hypothetical protein
MTASKNQPIVCTLQAGTYQERLAWIANLSRDALLAHERRELVLELRYAARAADRVHDMVRKEQECCAFLQFDLEHTAEEVRLTITAPERARDVADAVFEPFLPAASRSGLATSSERCCSPAPENSCC